MREEGVGEATQCDPTDENIVFLEKKMNPLLHASFTRVLKDHKAHVRTGSGPTLFGVPRDQHQILLFLIIERQPFLYMS